MLRRDYRLELTFAAPVLSHASGSMTLGLDAACLRYRGRMALNGSLVRGNLRHMLEDMADALSDTPEGLALAEDITEWFGLGADQGRGSHRRARVGFDFFWFLEESSVGAPAAQDQRSRAEMGEHGTVKSGHLQIVEQPIAVGEQPVFVGQLSGRFLDDPERERFEHWMARALAHMAALGAFKRVSFGRLLATRLTGLVPVAASRAPGETLPQGTRIGITLRLDRPFHAGLDALHQPRGNRWLHHDSIPGLVLKGVMAQAAGGDSQVLAEQLAFDDLVVTTAVPAPMAAPERRLPLPLSLALAGDRVWDLALMDGPCLLRVGREAHAPAFLPDWKDADREAAEDAFGHAPMALERFLSVRTSIDRGDGVAREGALFALDCTDPFGHLWCADLDLDAVDPAERPRVVESLGRLFDDGLDDIGKTRARARVAMAGQPFRAVPPWDALLPVYPAQGGQPEQRDDLQEDACFPLLLVSPARLLPADLKVPPSNGAQALHDLYDAYWRDASDGLLRLGHFFAQQEMVGGEFYNIHYRGGGFYRPEWLTVPGSVFVLRAQHDDLAQIQACIHRWLHRGLPPAADRDPAVEDWRSDPFMPQNGFGEVVYNWPQLARLSPDTDQFEPIDQGGEQHGL